MVKDLSPKSNVKTLKMYNNWDYPEGADNESAPWNQKDIKMKTIKAEVCFTVWKEIDVEIQENSYLEHYSINDLPEVVELQKKLEDDGWEICDAEVV